MRRIYIKDLMDKVDKTVEVFAWIQAIRKQGGLVFVVLRDVSGTIQGVIEKESDAFTTISEMNIESVIKAIGVVKKEKQAPGGYELKISGVTSLSESDSELPIPVLTKKGGKETAQEKRMDWRWIDLRKSKTQLIFKVWTTMEFAFVTYCTQNNYLRIHSPKLLPVPSEGASELFELPYFGKKAYLAQSPQLYKQMAMASGFERVYEIGPVFRANPSFTSRHDTEFTGYDIEISFVESHLDVIDEEENIVIAMLEAVKSAYGSDIKEDFQSDVVVPIKPFPRVTMTEAKKILSKLSVPSEKDGDLSPIEERKLSEYIYKKFKHEFVFVTEYPSSVRPFYHMRLSDGSDLTRSFDLLYRGIEITTGAQREHRYETLKNQAIEKGLNIEALKHYLNFFKYGCPPHGGLGFGPSRFLMKILDLPNVREVTYLYRGVKRLYP